MPEKTPLILLHGALGSKDQFQPLEEKLSNNFNTYSLNFEGHGGRGSEREFSMQYFMENVLELMEKENLDSASFFGYSMGGYVALKLALEQPDRVRKIMTLGTKFAWTEEAAHEEVARLNPLKIEEKVPKFARQLEKRHAPLDWHQVLSKTSEMMLDLGKSEAILMEDFKKLECPVLIGLGSEDTMVSREESEEVAATIPKGQYHWFEGFKHPLEQVDVARLARKMEEYFLGKDQ